MFKSLRYPLWRVRAWNVFPGPNWAEDRVVSRDSIWNGVCLCQWGGGAHPKTPSNQTPFVLENWPVCLRHCPSASPALSNGLPLRASSSTEVFRPIWALLNENFIQSARSRRAFYLPRTSTLTLIDTGDETSYNGWKSLNLMMRKGSPLWSK